MSRRFLYMVVKNGSYMEMEYPLSYTLHRINPSRLFYPKDSPERAAAAAAGASATTMEAAEASRERAQAAAAAGARRISMNTATDADAEKARLPRPTMTFSSRTDYMDFALTGRNKDQIVAVDRASRLRIPTEEKGCAVDRAVLYDDASHSVVALPGLTFPHHHAVSVALGNNLYLVGAEEDGRGVSDDDSVSAYYRGYDRSESSDHRVFVRGLLREQGDYYPYWYWHSFPPPPYLSHASETWNDYSDEVTSCAVVGRVGGWYILASTRGQEMTYSLNTGNGEWSKVSDSALPFRGPAVYAPEHGLWFGFPDEKQYYDNRLLGAWDLHAGADGPVEASGVWEGFVAEHFNSRSQLVHLGDGGRFCVANLFEKMKPPPASRCSRCYYEYADPPWMGFAVLTGVEVERCDGGELRMIKHRSCKYSLGLNSAHSLL